MGEKKKKKKSKESDERAVVQVKSNIKTSFENLPREGELKRVPRVFYQWFVYKCRWTQRSR